MGNSRKLTRNALLILHIYLHIPNNSPLIIFCFQIIVANNVVSRTENVLLAYFFLRNMPVFKKIFLFFLLPLNPSERFLQSLPPVCMNRYRENH